MSCIICDDTLPQNAPPTNYQKALGAKTYVKHGFPQFAVMKKSTVIADLNTIQDWVDACAAASLEMGPCGVFNLGTPNFTPSTDDSACGDSEILETVFTPIYSFYHVDKDNLTHADYLEDFLAAYRCLTIIPFDCCGNPWLNKEATDFVKGVTTAPMTSNPGLDFGMLQSPHAVAGDANNQKWQFQLEIKLPGEQMLRPSNIPGLFEALIAC